jgi:hypothetical protein
VQNQPWKVAHEPRKVRYQRQKYPTLRGSRDAARQDVLKTLGAVDGLLRNESVEPDRPPDPFPAAANPPDKTTQ